MRTSSHHPVLVSKSRREKKSISTPYTKMRKRKTSRTTVLNREEGEVDVLDSCLMPDETEECLELSNEELSAVLALDEKSLAFPSCSVSGEEVLSITEVEKTISLGVRLEKDHRIKPVRRRQIDPTTCERDYSSDEIEFMNALDTYKRENGRMFPTCSEILEVFLSLGYVKKGKEDPACDNLNPSKTTPVGPLTPALSPDRDCKGKEEPLSPYMNDMGSLPIF